LRKNRLFIEVTVLVGKNDPAKPLCIRKGEKG